MYIHEVELYDLITLMGGSISNQMHNTANPGCGTGI